MGKFHGIQWTTVYETEVGIPWKIPWNSIN
jgi:hypothetical protein